MLFSSHEFAFVFLPLVLVLYWFIQSIRGGAYIYLFIVSASLIFYAYYDVAFVALLLASIGLNYVVGRRLRQGPNSALLATGIAGNLGLLGYFKYFNFFADQINALTNTGIDFISVTLPLGISFFTFQQIAYLVDSHKQKVEDESLLRYALFVSFFPQLIAGPIVHHAEMMPQFKGAKSDFARNLLIGLTIFAIGLFKKTVIADGLDDYTRAFDVVAAGQTITLVESWAAVIAYTFQIYFDFSAYSDMAIGLARTFGIVLPVNFLSPYKASNPREFWRRWHITLSRFLRDYLYIPLGGSKLGEPRRYANLMITMTLGGLWHGASWNFVLWGVLHGAYLAIYQALSTLFPKSLARVPLQLGVVVTFTAVLVAWVPFRAADLSTTLEIYRSMIGMNGFVLPDAYVSILAPVQGLLDLFGLQYVQREILFDGLDQAVLYLFLLAIVWAAPNVIDIFQNQRPALLPKGYQPMAIRWPWRQSIGWAMAGGLVAGIALAGIDRLVEFIYFQF